MAFEPVINIWPGSSSFTTGSTPYGYYDTDAQFQTDADRFASMAAIRLGYPITNIELIDENFYAALEDATSKYGTMVSLFNVRDNLINVSGLPTGSVDLTSQYVTPTLFGVFRLARQYANEAGVGGDLVYYTGSITLQPNIQVYSFKDTGSVSIERGDFNNDIFTIRKIFHESFDANHVDALNIYSDYGMLAQFGWQGTTGESVVMPLNYDILRVQAIELSNQIRRSSYSFQLNGDRLRIFPIPQEELTLYFQYTLDSELLDANEGSGSAGAGDGIISDISNIPYTNLTYSTINDLGKDWIKRYALAECKEMLGLVRAKYSTIPFGNAEVTLNGESLITNAQAEMELLMTELKEMLESTSRQAQLERKQAESDAMQSQLMKVPLKIYVR